MTGHFSEDPVDQATVGTAADERVLIQKARGGDAQAFSALVRSYQEDAIHLAYSFLRNWEDARDVAQEAFVKAYQGLGGFRHESQFSTWLYRIVMNLCKDFLRRKKTRPADEPLDINLEVMAKGPDPRRSLMNQEMGAALQEAIRELPFRQQSVFVLRYLEGLPLEEIAKTAGISVGAVKAHLWQACEKMKKRLGGWRTEGGTRHE